MNLGEAARLHDAVDRLAAGLGGGESADLSVSAWQILREAARLGGDASPSTIAVALGLRRPNVSHAIRELQRGGLLEPDGAAPDARRRIVRLTAAGREVLGRSRTGRAHRLATLVATQLGADEARRLAEVVPLLTRLADTAFAADVESASARGGRA
ncbi:MarR family winged helix-turn-helix transcriptional regulator [Tsukamurella soli]|uniref:MarR family transcriptional regulator n=1 Tax=Tsukamurella soli TaxID=644556 RepID=A0ABP8KEY0_9ACTN